MKPHRIIPPKHYKGPKPDTKELIVRYCEGIDWVYAYLATGERLLCVWGEEWEKVGSGEGTERGAENPTDTGRQTIREG